MKTTITPPPPSPPSSAAAAVVVVVDKSCSDKNNRSRGFSNISSMTSCTTSVASRQQQPVTCNNININNKEEEEEEEEEEKEKNSKINELLQIYYQQQQQQLLLFLQIQQQQQQFYPNPLCHPQNSRNQAQAPPPSSYIPLNPLQLQSHPYPSLQQSYNPSLSISFPHCNSTFIGSNNNPVVSPTIAMLQQQQQQQQCCKPSPSPPLSSPSSVRPTIITTQLGRRRPSSTCCCWIEIISSMIHHQQQVVSSSSLRNNNDKTNNNKIRVSKLKSLKFVAIKMERNSYTQPWGLGFVSTTSTSTTKSSSSPTSPSSSSQSQQQQQQQQQNRVIVVSSPSSSSSFSSSTSSSNKNEKNNNHDVNVKWTRVVFPYQHTLNRNGIYRSNNNRSSNSNNNFFDPEHYSEQLKRTMSTTTTTTTDANQDKDDSGIRPGDIVVAIDGRSIFEFDTINNSNNNNHKTKSSNVMSEMTSYLKSIKAVCFVVLRHPDVVTTGVNINEVNMDTKNNNNKKYVYNPIRTSSMANIKWNKILFLSTSPVPAPATAPLLFPPLHVQQQQQTLYHHHQRQLSSIKKSQPPSFIVDTKESFLLPSIPTETKVTFQNWIIRRKNTVWRSRYKVYKYKNNINNKILSKEEKEKKKKVKKLQQQQKKRNDSGNDADGDNENDNENDRNNSTIPNVDAVDGTMMNVDFWTNQGFISFQDWISSRNKTWKRSYSWNQKKRQRIQNDCFDKVVYLPWSTATTNNNSNSNTNNNTISQQRQTTKSFSTKTARTSDNDNTKRKRDPDHQSSPSGAGSDTGCSIEIFEQWLNVRRYQWRMLRRRRKRQQNQQEVDRHTDDRATTKDDTPPCTTTSAIVSTASSDDVKSSSSLNDSPCDGSTTPRISSLSASEVNGGSRIPVCKRKLDFVLSNKDQEMAYIDEILEEKEKEKEELKRQRAERPPIDIQRFLDASNGIPDDIIVHCFSYLRQEEHGKMLVINIQTSKSLQDRYNVWKQLCPSHWILPRRPRKPWHTLYLTRLRKEQELHQKRWDDLLIKCAAALFKRDDLQKVEKLILKAEKDFGFDLNYSSGVVCERNSILNLAVINQRHKVVRWLVDTKGTNIETYDRGNFTPLLNAAWNGDRYLVRFFLQRQSNRNVHGTQHYTKGIAPPDFRGLTAEKWAEKRGFPDVAKLIKIGY